MFEVTKSYSKSYLLPAVFYATRKKYDRNVFIFVKQFLEIKERLSQKLKKSFVEPGNLQLIKVVENSYIPKQTRLNKLNSIV